MTSYEKAVRKTRKQLAQITLEQQRDVLKSYERAIDNLATKLSRVRDKTLTQRWLKDYKKELEKVRKSLTAELESQITKSVGKAALKGAQTEQQLLLEAFSGTGLNVKPSFSKMFSAVQKNVIDDIVSGGLYTDHKTLSSRIWNTTQLFEGDIQSMITQGILEKKSALSLARDLEKFVKPEAQRGWEWGKVYPNLKHTKIDYNAQRLARTSINHAYQTATIQSAAKNPYIDKIKWLSANIHGRTCDLCAERDGQLFPVDDVPLDHPNGLCTMISVPSRSLDQIADELNSWAKGELNPMLDDWYDKNGDYFAFKKI